MFEIGHAALNDPPPDELQPAQPILASQLLELEEKQRKRFTGKGHPERIITGCKEIDELFGGGVERGIVLGISAEGGEGRLISLQLLATILLSHLSSSDSTLLTNSSKSPPITSKAIIIDTAGSFSLPLLAKIIKSRLQAEDALKTQAASTTANHLLTKEGTKSGGENIEERVQRCLEMVALSRVFDIEGLWEVLSEVGRDTHEPLETQSKEASSPEKTQEIANSDDEASPISPIKSQDRREDDEGTEIIIIDNLSTIINSLFARREKSEAHTLLTSLSSTLYSHASRRNTLTILHNTTVPSKPSTYSSLYPSNAVRNTKNPNTNPNTPKSTKILPPTSIFASAPQKPGLGHIFNQFPSLHILLSTIPKVRRDAEKVYPSDEQSAAGEEEGEVEHCTVVEILKDETPILGSDKQPAKGRGERKFGWREQRWTAVVVDDGEIGISGTGFRGAFEERGNMRGMGLEREKVGGLTDVGRAAKVWGFGGRRV